MSKPKRKPPGRGVRMYRQHRHGVLLEAHFYANEVYVDMLAEGMEISIMLTDFEAHELGARLLKWVENHPERLEAARQEEAEIDFLLRPTEGRA